MTLLTAVREVARTYAGIQNASSPALCDSCRDSIDRRYQYDLECLTREYRGWHRSDKSRAVIHARLQQVIQRLQMNTPTPDTPTHWTEL